MEIAEDLLGFQERRTDLERGSERQSHHIVDGKVLGDGRDENTALSASGLRSEDNVFI